MKRVLSRRQMLKGMAGAAALTLGEAGQARAARPRPSIVFMLVDDQAWQALGYLGRYPFLKTPNMDRLAREGTRFDNAFVTTSLCSPSRASFLTGCHAHTHGVRTNDRNDPDPELTIFPQALQEAGYETAFVGKWHMAPRSGPRPGFDYWLSFLGQGQYENPSLNENGHEFQQEGYMTDLLTDYADAWLRQPRKKPFCLLLWHKAVHGPFTPAPRHAGAFPDAEMPKPANFDDTFADKPAWLRRALTYGARAKDWEASEGKEIPAEIPPIPWFGRNEDYLKYMRALLAVDESLGKVLATLEELGQLENTVVVFSSDNGFFVREHRLGDKRLMYEESLRIPLLVRYPRSVKAGAARSEMVLNIDVGPTLLDLAGARIPRSMQGRSFAPLLRGEEVPWRDSFFYAYYQEGWLPGFPTIFGVRTEQWKYIQCPKVQGDTDELYDLRNDPYELTNRIDDPACRDMRRTMEAELKRLMKKTRYREESKPVAITVPLQLALHYTFEDIRDEVVEDGSGNGFEGRLRKARIVAGRRGQALALDGEGAVMLEPAGKPFDPSMKPFTVGAWCWPEAEDGVLISCGGQSNGFSLYLKGGRPHFSVVSGGTYSSVAAGHRCEPGHWVHLAGLLAGNLEMRLYVNGERAGEAPAFDFILVRPNEGGLIGADEGTPVGSYDAPLRWQGLLDEVRVYWGELKDQALHKWVKRGGAP